MAKQTAEYIGGNIVQIAGRLKKLNEKKSDIPRAYPSTVYAGRIKISCNACNEYYGWSVFSK